MSTNIAIAGASGIIGQKLIDLFEKEGHRITVLTRNPNKRNSEQNSTIEFIRWNCKNKDNWKDSLEEKDIVINLAGTNLSSKRWNDRFKKEIYDSRIECTRQLVDAIGNCRKKPKTLISASAVGIYGDRGEELLEEQSLPGKDFLAKLCIDWEQEAKNVEKFGVRSVVLRIGLVLSKQGGLLKKSLIPYRFFVGGKLGNGRQYFPWIHIDDLAYIIYHVIRNMEINGAINCAAPEIVIGKDFSNTLGKVLNRPSFIPVPKIILRMAVGEIANVITSGQNISVKKLMKSGYQFKYPELTDALKNLLKK